MVVVGIKLTNLCNLSDQLKISLYSYGQDSSRAPGLTSGLQGSVNVHRGALLLVPQ